MSKAECGKWILPPQAIGYTSRAGTDDVQSSFDFSNGDYSGFENGAFGNDLLYSSCYLPDKIDLTVLRVKEVHFSDPRVVDALRRIGLEDIFNHVLEICLL
jgi:hypothetical protein